MTIYYVDGLDGNDGNAGTSEGSGNAWATNDHAMNAAVSGDTVYVKNSVTYTELATIDTAGAASGIIRFEGYATTPGDGGQVTIDAENTRTNCITNSLGSTPLHYLFSNFIFDDATGDCVDTVGGDVIQFFNCAFINAGDRGFQGDNEAIFIGCRFAGNTTGAADMDVFSAMLFCEIDCAASAGVIASECPMFGNLFYNLGASNTAFDHNAQYLSPIINCTFDGEGNSATTLIDMSGVTLPHAVVMNTILYDAAVGVEVANGLQNGLIMINDLLNSLTAEYTTNTSRYEVGKVTSAPGFTNEAADDYSLAGGSAALNAGFYVDDVA